MIKKNYMDAYDIHFFKTKILKKTLSFTLKN